LASAALETQWPRQKGLIEVPIRLATGVTLARLLMHRLQQGAEGSPVNDAVEPRQWIAYTFPTSPADLFDRKSLVASFLSCGVSLRLFCQMRGIIRGAH